MEEQISLKTKRGHKVESIAESNDRQKVVESHDWPHFEGTQ